MSSKAEFEKEVVHEFIEWARINSKHAWWIYDETDEAVDQFLKYRENED